MTVRTETAAHLRGLAHRIWCRWRLDEIRYISDTDAVVIRVVALLDKAANRLDPPY